MKASQPLAFLVGITGAVALAESNSQLRRSLLIGGAPTTNLEFPFYVQSKNVRCATVLVLAVAFLLCADSHETSNYPLSPCSSPAEGRLWRRTSFSAPHTARVRKASKTFECL
jgi:hypothetical protein